MRLLLDTHVLIWAPTGDPRLPSRIRDALIDPDNELFVSAVTAFELTDLQARKRIAMTEDIATLSAALGFAILDWPAQAWAVVATLPTIHGDPVDRMLIAHASLSGMTIVTSDATIPDYPVKTLW